RRSVACGAGPGAPGPPRAPGRGEGEATSSVTQPRLAEQTEYGRMYARAVADQATVPSITTVLSRAATDLDGWYGYSAAQAAVRADRLRAALGSPAQLRAVVRDAAKAAERHRDEAAARGDRVHTYAEQIALRALGRPHRAAE